jgi:hypothetical protein
MKILLAIALLFGFASFTTAHAEWEILDTGSAVYAGASIHAPATNTATSTAPATTASSTAKDTAPKNATKEVAKQNATSN